MANDIPGGLSISNEVIADLAGYAALECYGVVGTAGPTFQEGLDFLMPNRTHHSHLLFTEFLAAILTTLFPLHKLRRGIVIESRENGVHIDLFVIMEYGTNIPAVSANLIERVAFVVSDLAGVKVEAVEVHVQGVKVRS